MGRYWKVANLSWIWCQFNLYHSSTWILSLCDEIRCFSKELFIWGLKRWHRVRNFYEVSLKPDNDCYGARAWGQKRLFSLFELSKKFLCCSPLSFFIQHDKYLDYSSLQLSPQRVAFHHTTSVLSSSFFDVNNTEVSCNMRFSLSLSKTLVEAGKTQWLRRGALTFVVTLSLRNCVIWIVSYFQKMGMKKVSNAKDIVRFIWEDTQIAPSTILDTLNTQLIVAFMIVISFLWLLLLHRSLMCMLPWSYCQTVETEGSEQARSTGFDSVGGPRAAIWLAGSQWTEGQRE